jgi:predicted TIM-barrel enzyme
MGKRIPRDEILNRLRGQIAAQRSILVVGAGNGLVARCAEDAGADLIVVYNSGHYRLNGLASLVGNLPVGDANAMVVEMGRKGIIQATRDVPVIGGVYGVDPTRNIEDVLESLEAVNYSGVINFPTVGRVDGRYRQELEASGLGYGKEIEMVRVAHERGLFTMAYVFNADEAARMAEAGLDVLVGHVGLTGGGDVGSSMALDLDGAVTLLESIYAGARRVRSDMIFLSHGGPIIDAGDAEYVNERTGAVGFVAASSVERIPVEVAVKNACRSFKSIGIGSRTN